MAATRPHAVKSISPCRKECFVIQSYPYPVVTLARPGATDGRTKDTASRIERRAVVQYSVTGLLSRAIGSVVR